jgi:hypothetical protein
MAYFGFHGRYKSHCYEDCKDHRLQSMNWYQILNIPPSEIPSNILTNSCSLKKINEPNYISSIQLDAIQHLLKLKEYIKKYKIPNNDNYIEDLKNNLITKFQTKYSDFCNTLYDVTPQISKLDSEANDLVVDAYGKVLDKREREREMEREIDDLSKRYTRLKKSGGKKSSKRKRTKIKTRRRKSKKCFSLF